MKEKTKEFLKKYLIGFILGFVSVGIVAVYAETYFPSNDVTYDNRESGLTSTNVQGAIDELYGVCFPSKTGSDIITDLVEINTDELYKDDKENIRYYGKNPDNYVSFNNELWRIIGVIDGKIKIIRNESIGSKAWASNGYNNWNNSDLKSYLNENYYNSINSIYKNMISEATFYLGGPTNSNGQTLTASEYYDIERSNTVYGSNPKNVIQYIGLMYPSDYGYAAGNRCLSITLNNYNTCTNNNYLFKSITEWLQTPNASLNNQVTYIYQDGYVINNNYSSTGNKAVYTVRPTLYLSSEVKITGGTGTSSDPYQISL